MSETEFAGRTALVTGGSRGIGRAVCLRLAQGGARVAVNYARDDKAAAETKAGIEAAGAACALVKADVSDPEAVIAMAAATEAELGPVDLLVTSAGVMVPEQPTGLNLEQWRRTMAANADGTYFAVTAVKDGMMARRFGRIVCISSIAALRPRPHIIAYTASKAAVVAMARSWAEAFAPHVRVNCVAPGLTESDMSGQIPAPRLQSMIEATPLKRIGQPEEIAEMVAFLLSERSSFTTGQTLVADGGRVTLP